MSMTEVRVEGLPRFEDPEGTHAAHRLGLEGDDVTVVNTYRLEGLSPDQIALVMDLLHDPATQEATADSRQDWDDERVVRVAPKPGVMDPNVDPIFTILDRLGVGVEAVQTSTEYHFDPDVPSTSVEEAKSTLANVTVEQILTEAPDTLIVHGEAEPVVRYDLAAMNDEELASLSKVREVELSLKEMRAIQAESIRMGRPVTDAEIEYLGGAWSEHCRHKTFNAEIIGSDGERKPALFWRIKEGSTPYFEEQGVLSAFHDNSGVWAFYDGTALCIKLETHNSPMNKEPYGGAATGTGGVLRDIVGTGRGARIINSIHIQCLAPLDLPDSEVPPGCHSPRYLMERSVAGVGDYGNRMGVPTNDVSFHAHPDFRGKGTVLVGAMGIMPESRAQKGAPEHGDFVVAVGGKTGRDGVHGANFSSVSADSETGTTRHVNAVQIGNSIEQKMMFDAIEEATERGLIRALTDCGASGFASAIGEIGEDIGVQVDLTNAPLKYSGLSAWEIFISESQERMVLAIDPEHYDELAAIFAKHGSNCDIFGTFGSPEGQEPTLHVEHNGETVIDLRYDFIKNGVPIDPLEALWEAPVLEERPPQHVGLKDALTAVLRNGNVCSTEAVQRRYDHEVQGTSALKPYDGPTGHGRNEAVVLTPILGKPYAVVQAHGTNPTLTELDPVRGTKWVYAEAVANSVAAGANPDRLIAVNNYIAPTPTPRVMGALDLSVDTLMQECVAEFHSPIISGKDSLSSTLTLDDGVIEAPYNLTVTVAGNIPNVAHTVSNDIKSPGSVLVLVGAQDLEAMGGSIYYTEHHGVSTQVPDTDMKQFHQTARSVHAAIQTGSVLAAQDVSEGGVISTITQMLFGGDCGADITISDTDELFNETAGCFVLEVPDETALEQFAGVPHKVIGTTKADKTLSVQGHGDMSVDELLGAWQQPFEELLS